MSKAQRRVLAVLLAIVFLDLAVTQRFTKLWNHAFSATKGASSGNSSNQ